MLEDGAKRLATSKGITIRSDTDLGGSITLLFQAKVINAVEQSQLRALAVIRNKAAHGEYDEYDAEQVRGMLGQVGDFLVKHL